ncbi:MAG: hypothetical protein ABI282_05795, partial [Candidatus Baltobacteraceae bacterium]
MRRFFAGIFFALAAGMLCSCGGSHATAPINPVVQQNTTRSAFPAAVSITEFSNGLPKDHSPFLITRGPDGNMWFTDYIDPDFGSSFIGRISPSGVVKKFYYGNAQLTFPSLNG